MSTSVLLVVFNAGFEGCKVVLHHWCFGIIQFVRYFWDARLDLVFLRCPDIIHFM